MLCRQLSDSEIIIETVSADETAQLGKVIGEHAYPGLIILMYGGLGAGKTVIAKNIGAALGYPRIKSPTFIIVAEHYGGKLPLAHADLYRLSSAEEVDTLDLEQYVEQRQMLIVEWAERWDTPPIGDCMSIKFEEAVNESEKREIILMSHGEMTRSLLKHIYKSLRPTGGVG